jgi:hypothetical protein
MPTNTTGVGPLTLPIPTTGTNSDLDDVTLVGLLDYLAFWLRLTLNSKLAEQGGPTTAGAITDACPTSHLFPWHHQGTFVRPLPGGGSVPLPGMWAWEESAEPTDEFATLLYDVVKRVITVQYIFPELTAPKGVVGRNGLLAAAMRTFANAAEWGRHPTYGFDGEAVNTPIATSCDWRHWRFKGSKQVLEASLPGTGSTSQAATRAAGAEKRFYPSLLATFEVWERVSLRTASVADDMVPGTTTIQIVDDSISDNALDVMERTLETEDSDDD